MGEKTMNIILLSGGSGKRLWPLSNDVRSKQFIKLFKDENGNYESMVQRVYRQVTTVDANAKITIATSKSQASAIKNQLGEKVAICVEPCRRDTFPAIALAASYLHDELGVGENEAVVVCPVDPYVDNTYYEAVGKLQKLAEEGKSNLTLLGIEPTYPSEKYGYIIPVSGENVSVVSEFKEKPNTETAKKYMTQKALWNAGIFAFKLGYLLNTAHKGIYRKVKKLLQEKNKVLFIGLPCQIAAVKNFVGEQNKDNLYTVDLICHGTPSVKILEKYMSQYGVSLSEIKDISFRTKNAFILKKDGKPITGHHIQDRYTMSFLSSLNYTENCYYCRYATDKRVGDITIGDAWGSDLKEEIDNGISLIMCQTEKGEELLELTPFHLDNINIDEALKNNHQLRHPAIMPPKREQFFKEIKKGRNYNAVIARIYPKICLKQKIKNMIFVFRNSKKMS